MFHIIIYVNTYFIKALKKAREEEEKGDAEEEEEEPITRMAKEIHKLPVQSKNEKLPVVLQRHAQQNSDIYIST